MQQRLKILASIHMCRVCLELSSGCCTYDDLSLNLTIFTVFPTDNGTLLLLLILCQNNKVKGKQKQLKHRSILL